MRSLLPLVAPLALLLLALPTAPADDTAVCAADAACFRETRAGADCGSDALSVHGPRVHLEAEGRRDCRDPETGASGHAIVVSLIEPDGHESFYWEEHREDGADYRSFMLARPPRFVFWHEDRYGCTTSFSVVGNTDLGCPAGGPPAPPHLAWGHLLP